LRPSCARTQRKAPPHALHSHRRRHRIAGPLAALATVTAIPRCHCHLPRPLSMRRCRHRRRRRHLRGRGTGVGDEGGREDETRAEGGDVQGGRAKGGDGGGCSGGDGRGEVAATARRVAVAAGGEEGRPAPGAYSKIEIRRDQVLEATAVAAPTDAQRRRWTNWTSSLHAARPPLTRAGDSRAHGHLCTFELRRTGEYRRSASMPSEPGADGRAHTAP